MRQDRDSHVVIREHTRDIVEHDFHVFLHHHRIAAPSELNDERGKSIQGDERT